MIKQHLSLVKASNAKDYYTVCKVRQFTIIADEPITIEGTDLGPSPFDLLNVSLASCTAMYLNKQAKKHQIDTGEIVVKTKIVKEEDTSLTFERHITFANQVKEQDKQILLEASKNTPVTKVISNSQKIETRLL